MQSTEDTRTRTESENKKLTAKERQGEKWAVDITHESGPSLLIQAGRGGYKLDTWWGENKQANNWVRLGSQPSDYPYNNEHDRDVTTPNLPPNNDDEVAVIDPDPRGYNIGYNIATITVRFVEHEGFHVTVKWTEEETGNKMESFAIAPVFDPRFDDEREVYYKLMDENNDGTPRTET